MNHASSRLLRQGETCWRLARADRAAILFDAAGYFGALRAALLGAKRSIALVGWDIDSRTPIRGASAPDDGAPETLGPLLSWLVERNADLVVHVLLWDYSVLYALEREPLPRLKLDWKTPRRVEVCLDSQLPFGASHHEKLVVIDDGLAFCGGIDLTIRRWDRPAHRPDDPDRRDPEGEPYDPFHDLQWLVDGAAARALAELVYERWNRVTGGSAEPDSAGLTPWPGEVTADFRDVEIGIARTRPAYADEAELRQVESAYLESIARAERLVYVENQYLTVERIAAALCRQLRANADLEVVVVNPKMPGGWLEAQTMGQRRARFLELLAPPDVAARVRVLYPWVAADGEQVPVMVHAKLMIVDDRVLQLGSSNLNCRSMGVDRECDLLVEAQDERERRTIASLRDQLIAHHLGVEADEITSVIESGSGLIAKLDALDSGARGLRPVPKSNQPAGAMSDLLVEVADPERPIAPESFIGDLFGAVPGHPLRRHALRLLGTAALIGTILAVWRFTPLGDWAEPDRVAGLVEAAAASRWSGPVVLACFVLGSFLIFPVTVLVAGTAAALGPVDGFVWASAGSLLAAALNFGAGRLLPERALESWLGDWIGKVKQKLHRGGIVSIMIIRNLPIAPFSVVNLVAGAARIRVLHFLAGTALGMAPGIAALTILGDRLRGVWQDPGWLNIGLLVAAVGAWVGLAVGLQVLSNRFADDR